MSPSVLSSGAPSRLTVFGTQAAPTLQTTTANSLYLFQMTGLMFAGHGSFGDVRNQYKRRRNHMIRREHASGCFLALLGFLAVSPLSHAQEPQQPMVYEGPVGGLRVIEEGQPPVMIHATMEQMKQFREANPNARPGSVQAAATTNDLFYHGGTGGIGVETAPKIFLVLWGSQWNNNDPSAEAAI